MTLKFLSRSMGNVEFKQAHWTSGEDSDSGSELDCSELIASSDDDFKNSQPKPQLRAVLMAMFK